jgi:peptidyl-tRNA hydrolase
MKYDKKQAKMDVLKQIMEHMDSLGGKSLGEGLQKVTVAAKDKKGLIEGLSKAKEVMSGSEEEEEAKESDMPEGEESSADESKAELLKKLLSLKK